jgi:hypothetical protein
MHPDGATSEHPIGVYENHKGKWGILEGCYMFNIYASIDSIPLVFRYWH